jgi:uncharacterized damage-inducible protein DinB
VSRSIYLDQGLALSPAAFRQITALVSPSRLDQSLATDRFTLREVIAHLADMEPVFRARMELALRAPGSEVENFDQDKEALEKNYASWDVQKSLTLFAEARRKTLELFLSLDERQLALTVKHPILGEVSVFGLGVFLLGHDMYHLEQATAYLGS